MNLAILRPWLQRDHLSTTGSAAAAHLRLGLLKLERKVMQRGMHSCWRTSCCTRGVAVAVSAISGTRG
jgi:hypothetical protein